MEHMTSHYTSYNLVCRRSKIFAADFIKECTPRQISAGIFRTMIIDRSIFRTMYSDGFEHGLRLLIISLYPVLYGPVWVLLAVATCPPSQVVAVCRQTPD